MTAIITFIHNATLTLGIAFLVAWFVLGCIGCLIISAPFIAVLGLLCLIDWAIS